MKSALSSSRRLSGRKLQEVIAAVAYWWFCGEAVGCTSIGKSSSRQLAEYVQRVVAAAVLCMQPISIRHCAGHSSAAARWLYLAFNSSNAYELGMHTSNISQHLL